VTVTCTNGDHQASYTNKPLRSHVVMKHSRAEVTGIVLAF